MSLVTKAPVRERTKALDEAELRASQRLVTIIGVLLGLTLVSGAVAYHGMFTQGAHAPAGAYLAMALVYFVAVRSFIDWHMAMEMWRYRIFTDGRRSSELVRALLDFAIMASYSFLILRGHVLIDHPGADLTAIAIAFPAIYVAYIVWGALLNRAHPADGKAAPFAPGFSARLLGLMAALSAALLFVYEFGRSEHWLGRDHEDLNIVFLAVEFALVFAFRLANWSQQVIVKDELPPAENTV